MGLHITTTGIACNVNSSFQSTSLALETYKHMYVYILWYSWLARLIMPSDCASSPSRSLAVVVVVSMLRACYRWGCLAVEEMLRPRGNCRYKITAPSSCLRML